MATSGAPCTLTRMGMDVSRSSGREILRILALPAWLTVEENTSHARRLLFGSARRYSHCAQFEFGRSEAWAEMVISNSCHTSLAPHLKKSRCHRQLPWGQTVAASGSSHAGLVGFCRQRRTCIRVEVLAERVGNARQPACAAPRRSAASGRLPHARTLSNQKTEANRMCGSEVDDPSRHASLRSSQINQRAKEPRAWLRFFMDQRGSHRLAAVEAGTQLRTELTLKRNRWRPLQSRSWDKGPSRHGFTRYRGTGFRGCLTRTIRGLA